MVVLASGASSLQGILSCRRATRVERPTRVNMPCCWPNRELSSDESLGAIPGARTCLPRKGSLGGDVAEQITSRQIRSRSRFPASYAGNLRGQASGPLDEVLRRPIVFDHVIGVG